MTIYQYLFGSRRGLILKQGDGLGEIAPLPGFSRETFEEALDELLLHLRTGAPASLPSVRWGLACAAKPFSCEPLRVSLCALHRPLPGCGALKLKLGSLSPSDAIALVQPLVGRYRLRLDCNRSWTLRQALQFAAPFAPTDFEYLEEPLSDFSDLIEFSARTRFPIAVDESFRENLPYLKIPTLKAVVIKPTLTGHIPSLPVPIVLSSSYESSLGLLQIARHAAPHIAHGLDTFTSDLLSSPLRLLDGHLVWTPSKTPIDWSKLCPVR